MKKGLEDAYSIKTPDDSIKLYKVWASTYDNDFATKNDLQQKHIFPTDNSDIICDNSTDSDKVNFR